MAQPVSGVPGGKVITDPVPFQRLSPLGRVYDQSIIMPPTLLSALHTLTYSVLTTTLRESTVIIIPILQRKKLRPRKVK